MARLLRICFETISFSPYNLVISIEIALTLPYAGRIFCPSKKANSNPFIPYRQGFIPHKANNCGFLPPPNLPRWVEELLVPSPSGGGLGRG
jgi:hypothetical protein